MRRKVALPRGWNRRVKSVILPIPALGHYTLIGVSSSQDIAAPAGT